MSEPDDGVRGYHYGVVDAGVELGLWPKPADRATNHRLLLLAVAAARLEIAAARVFPTNNRKAASEAHRVIAVRSASLSGIEPQPPAYQPEQLALF